MAGRKRHHQHCPKSTHWTNDVVNVYVRVGSPSKWTVIGEVCLSCHQFAHIDSKSHLAL